MVFLDGKMNNTILWIKNDEKDQLDTKKGGKEENNIYVNRKKQICEDE